MVSKLSNVKSGAKQAATRSEYQKRFLERQGWIDAVQARRDLSLTARLVGGRIGLHKNLTTGQCNPGAGTLAGEAGIAERAAFRAIAELERKGCIAVDRTRGGAKNNSNSYTLIPPIEPSRGDTVSGVGAPVRGDNGDSGGVTPCHANIKRNIGGCFQHPPYERDSELVLAPDPGGPLNAAPGFEERKQAVAEEEILPAAEIISPSKVPSLNQEKIWRALRTMWERPHAEDQRADRKAFDAACREIAPEHILAAAPAWLAAYEPRYRQPLHKWLADRGWEKSPPERGKRKNGHRSNASVSTPNQFLKEVGFVEGEDGEMFYPEVSS
jgi:hypothetical protein